MSEPMRGFTGEILNIDDVVVYLKNERTGSSTIRKCKFIGQIIGFTNTKVKIRRLSPPDVFVTPEETQDYGEVSISPDEVVGVVISKHDRDMTKALVQSNKLMVDYKIELEFTRNFIHKHGLEFALASAWDKCKNNI